MATQAGFRAKTCTEQRQSTGSVLTASVLTASVVAAPLARACRQGVLAFLLALLPLIAFATDDPWDAFETPWFDRVGIAEGLPHSLTTALAQDQRGLLWIGTLGGLVRYDGYRMQVFTANGGPKADLPDAYVRSLLALPDGGLLVGTNSGGLTRFDPQLGTFHRYPVGKGGTSDRKIYALAMDGRDGAWVASERGLDHLDLRSNRIAPVPLAPPLSLRSFSVLQDRAGNLWLGNNQGLFFRHAGAKTFSRAPRTGAGSVVDAVLNDGIWALHEDRAGRLWVGSTQAGAAYRDPDGHWHAVDGFSGYQRGGERRATVRAFIETSTDILWIATDGNGVLAYTPGNDKMRPIVHDTAMPSSLPGDSVRALLRDRSDNIWVATDLGVARTTPGARKAFALLPSTRDDHALANTNVRGVFVDSRRRIWLGMSAGCIDVIDLDRGVIRHLKLGGNQTRRDVQAFTQTPDGSIWVGTQGLARIDPDSLSVQDSVVPALDALPVLHLLADGSQLTVGTYDGVYRYDTRSRALSHFRNDPNDPTSLTNDTVRLIDRIGSDIWYVTGHGISIAASPAQTRGFTNLLNRPGDPASLPNNLASSIARDPQGTVWVGTYGGLATLEPRGKEEPYRFRAVDMHGELPSDNINALQSDEQGNLWVSLPNGLAMIDGITHAVHVLGARDGLRIASYIYAAAARAPDGELLFGGLGGLTVLRPAWQPPEQADATLAVTHAVINGTPLPFGRLPRAGETFHLGARNRSLRVDFALLDYQAPNDTSYSYRMEGLDEDWIEVPRGSPPAAIYTNLPHGDYTLRLRAQTHGMQPRILESALGVTAEPRWYETIAAMIGAGVLLLSLLIAVIQLRTMYLRRQARQLQDQVDLRTRDLLVANQRLDELASIDSLTGAYNRRRFFELAEQLRLKAADGDTCMALLDIDGFKDVNDTYGHLAGDAIIRSVGETMLHLRRESDLVGRYGGEELVACLPGAVLPQGLAIAERIRVAVADNPMEYEGQRIAVTVSIGVAAWRQGETLSQWLSRADDALYEAKRSGRNRVVAAP